MAFRPFGFEMSTELSSLFFSQPGLVSADSLAYGSVKCRPGLSSAFSVFMLVCQSTSSFFRTCARSLSSDRNFFLGGGTV